MLTANLSLGASKPIRRTYPQSNSLDIGHAQVAFLSCIKTEKTAVAHLYIYHLGKRTIASQPVYRPSKPYSSQWRRHRFILENFEGPIQSVPSSRCDRQSLARSILKKRPGEKKPARLFFTANLLLGKRSPQSRSTNNGGFLSCRPAPCCFM